MKSDISTNSRTSVEYSAGIVEYSPEVVSNSNLSSSGSSDVELHMHLILD